MVRTRFAPSPTGDLHLGGAWAALAAWVWARRAGGEHVLRVDDLDTPRVVDGAEGRILADLQWLGLGWDGAAIRQSERTALYAEAVTSLARQGLVYPCDCSRADIARDASAPHAGEELVYPGTCRDRDPTRAMRRAPSLRARVPDDLVVFEDGIQGRVEQRLAREVGDFVLRRSDGVFAYQLAVVVDDVATGVTQVIRGADLVPSTPRQIWLARALGLQPPEYAHVPLVVAAAGARLEKRGKAPTVAALRAAGVGAAQIVGELAFGLGLAPGREPLSAREVAGAWSGGQVIPWRTEPWPVPPSLVAG